MATSLQSDLQPFVDRLATHSSLSQEEREAILRLPFRTYKSAAHRDIVRLGEWVDHTCFILNGLVGRFGQNADGARQITALHISGDMADLHSVVLPRGTSALQALAETTVLKVPHAALRAAAARYPAIAEAFWRACSIDAAILSQWVVNVGRRDSRTRVAHLLCEMAVRYGANVNPQGSYELRMTQNHLADATAMTAVHTNRTLQALRASGLARLAYGRVEILDWEELRAAGEFDPGYLGAPEYGPEPLRLLHPT